MLPFLASKKNQVTLTGNHAWAWHQASSYLVSSPLSSLTVNANNHHSVSKWGKGYWYSSMMAIQIGNKSGCFSRLTTTSSSWFVINCVILNLIHIDWAQHSAWFGLTMSFQRPVDVNVHSASSLVVADARRGAKHKWWVLWSDLMAWCWGQRSYFMGESSETTLIWYDCFFIIPVRPVILPLLTVW